MFRVVLVLWYKDGFGKPIYSYDLRERGEGFRET
jgi:hypothetical protein